MIDMIGNKYGRLTVVSFDRLEKHKTYWKCACDCGMSVVVSGNNLRSGNTKSCGCIHREQLQDIGRANKKHGYGHGSKDRLYRIWCGMRQRCNNPNHHAKQWYGGKGIKVCDEWNDFLVFKDWAMSNGYAENLSIDRIDSAKDYCPENCQWLTISDNVAKANKNHTTRKVIRGEGKSQPQRIEGEIIPPRGRDTAR